MRNLIVLNNPNFRIMKGILSVRYVLFFAFLFVFQSCTNETEEKTYDRNGNNVVVRIPADIRTLNPTFAFDAYSLLVLRTINQYLANYDLETQEIVPVLLKDLATITEEEGMVSYSMEIRPEAKWDDGSDVTAEDVLTSLKMLFNPMSRPSPYRPYLDFVEDFQIDSDNNKKFTIRSSKKFILAEEAIYMVMPVHQAAVYDEGGILNDFSLSDLMKGEVSEEDKAALTTLSETYFSEKFTSDPASVNGSGPYALKAWKPGELITMVKKADWWGNAFDGENSWFKAYPDTFTLKPVTDVTTAIQMFSNKEFDVAISLDSKDFVSLSSNESLNQEYNFVTDASNTAFLVYQNMKSPILSDKKVRQAVARLYDYDAIIESVFDGLGDRINGPVGDFKPYYDKESKMIAFDTEEALSLLTDAGWSDTDSDGVLDKEIDGTKTDLKLTYVVGSTSASENIALFFQQAAEEVGMDIEIIKKDRKGWLELMQQRDFDLTMNGTGFSPGLDDFRQMFSTDANTPGGQNRMQFGNAETDALLNAIVENFDEKSRSEQYVDFQKILADEMPIVWLMTPKSRVVIHDRFDGGSSGLLPNVCLGCMKLK